jgi:imidazolonepropionase-like amidohydrolase
MCINLPATPIILMRNKNIMKNQSLKIKFIFLILIFLAQLLQAQIAIKAEKIYTMAGNVINNGVILCENDKIIKTGKADEIDIPAHYKIIEGKIATPGLIDAHSVVGLAGIYNQKHDQDQLETSDPIQPELRAFDAYNPKEKLVRWLLEFGVTTINTGHAPGALSSGQTMIVKTDGSFEGNILDSTSAVVFSLGTEVSGKFKKPGTRPKGIAMLREAFYKAKNYLSKTDEDKAPFNLENDILAQVLTKKVPAIITANTAVDILAALRLAKEFHFNLILDGAAESYLVIDEIKAAGVPVILHPMMARIKNLSFETPKLLAENNILFAIQGGYESYVPKTRNVFFEAGIAAANGLSFKDALASITISAAKILKIDKQVGSIEAGKDADIVLFDGDPFEYTSHVCTVIQDGKLKHSTCK